MLTVAIDLDETLVCVTHDPLAGSPNATCSHGNIYIRPHAFSVLASLSASTTVGIWSSAPTQYVNDVLDASGLTAIDLAFVWTGRDCTFRDYGTGKIYYYKDTNQLRSNFSTESVLLVDNSPAKIVGHGSDSIVVASFTGDDDDELLAVDRFIRRLQATEAEMKFDRFDWRALL